jgi:hypothetical protein
MMKALYNNRIYQVVEADGDLVLKGSDGVALTVDYGDEELIVDPTDSEIADADNLADWYGVGDERLERLRLFLSGQISLSEWRR